MAATRSGCTNLGYLYAEGLGVTQDLAQARALYTQGCDGGDAIGCANLGGLLLNGDGGPKDVARAVTLFDDACQQGEEVGLRMAGLVPRIWRRC